MAECSFDPCNKTARIRGLCDGHAEQVKRGLPLRTLNRRAAPGTHPETCTFDGCDRKYVARDYCAVHYAQWRNSKNGVRTIAKMHPGEWGDWHVGTNGYVTRDRRMPGAKRNEHQSQHRYVMEQHLGRALLTGENVHHINGHRDQNNIENLELWTRAQPAGQRVKDLLAWAEEIIRTYGPLSESGRL